MGDSIIDNLWNRYDRAHREYEAARDRFDLENSRFLGQDLEDFIRRIEARGEEVQNERMGRTYPPQSQPRKGHGKGKGGGKPGKVPDKRQRTGGAPRW